MNDAITLEDRPAEPPQLSDLLLLIGRECEQGLLSDPERHAGGSHDQSESAPTDHAIPLPEVRGTMLIQ